MSRRNRQRSQRARPIPTNPPQLPTAVEWKNHPVIVAAATCAGTTLLCIAVVTQWVIPTQTAKLELELLKLKDVHQSTSEALRRKSESEASLKKQLEIEKKGAKKLSEDLLMARTSDLFVAGTPYPNSLGRVRIGMPLAAVYEAFPKSDVKVDEDDPRRLYIDLKDSPFREISYKANERDGQQKITSIAITLDYYRDWPDNFLTSRLLESFGPPTENPGSGDYRWQFGDYNAFQVVPTSYMIVAKGYAPAVWPD